jgi:hypothetical protein
VRAWLERHRFVIRGLPTRKAVLVVPTLVVVSFAISSRVFGWYHEGPSKLPPATTAPSSIKYECDHQTPEQRADPNFQTFCGEALSPQS